MGKLSKVEQYRIYTYYVGTGFLLGTPYISPLPVSLRGKEDRSSSFNIYESTGGTLRWKDFGSGGELRGDCIDFIIAMEPTIHCLPKKKQYSSAIKFYEKVIKNNNLLPESLVLNQANRHSIVNSKRISPLPLYDFKFTKSELKYWCGHPLAFPEHFLKRKRIYGLRGIDWGKGPMFPSKEDDPAFIYDLSEKGDMSSWKAYRPLTKNKRYKWKSWNLNAIPFEGYFLLPDTAPILLFTSSYKDGGVAENPTIQEHFKWACGNPTGEGAYRSILPYQNELNERFPTILILFDGDKAGVKAATDLAELTGWKAVLLNYPIKTGKRLQRARMNGESENTKDLAEIVENYGYTFLKKLLIKTLVHH